MPHSLEWYQLIPGLNRLESHVAHALIVALILILAGIVFNRALAARGEQIVPEGKLTIVSFFEVVFETIYGLMTDSLGHHAREFTYLVGGFALFILSSNLLGLIPGFAPPTDNANTTAALAIVVFLATHFYGVKAHGLGYLKHFTGPFWWLAWLMIPIEIISHLARPLSLTLRLFGNLMGDHLVYAIFVGMTVTLCKAIISASPALWIFAPLSVLVPAITILLGIFVAFVQTFVFLLLSMTYFAGAVAEEH